MDIHLAGSRPTRRAPPEYFTGTVLQDPIIATEAPARLVSTRVSFEPGARTAWHSHPLGQTLYVISGVGRVQAKGGPIREIRPGDVVWIPPGEKHWHGASPTNGMTHIAMQEALDGSYVDLDGEGHGRRVFRKSRLARSVARSRCPSTRRRARCPIPTCLRGPRSRPRASCRSPASREWRRLRRRGRTPSPPCCSRRPGRC